MPIEGKPRRKRLLESKTYRIIPSRFPPIGIFESLGNADDLEILFALESISNDRLRAQAGDLYLVPNEEWITGPGATVVMAAFTHIGHESRFSDGGFGIYYAALDEETAIRETVFNQERRLQETREPPIDIEMRCYIGGVTEMLDDIRSAAYEDLHNPSVKLWKKSQAFGATRREVGSNGLLYRSVRNSGGLCIAAFRPKAVTLPVQSHHYIYKWNGDGITQVNVVSDVISI